ncbi:MAG: hypothetical protein ACI90V_009738 [Bacillariaceae sp.]|jgi:hypothetical protein
MLDIMVLALMYVCVACTNSVTLPDSRRRKHMVDNKRRVISIHRKMMRLNY